MQGASDEESVAGLAAGNPKSIVRLDWRKMPMELRAIAKLLETTRIHFGLPLQAAHQPVPASSRKKNAADTDGRNGRAASREPANAYWRGAA